MKTIILFLTCSLIGISSNTFGQMYLFSDKVCDVKIQVKRSKDSANLALEFVNNSDQSIFTGRMYYARWNVEKEAIRVNFGDDYKNWRENNYKLIEIKPKQKLYLDLKVKDYFTDSTGLSFISGFMLAPPSTDNGKTFTNRDLQQGTLTECMFGFYPTLKPDHKIY